MANTINEIINNAKAMINGHYYYIYGMKGQIITEGIVNRFIKQYPNIYDSKTQKIALSRVGKGYGIDCSGFVCKAAGVSFMGSGTINSTAPHKWSIKDVSHVKSGMYIWKQGHVALIEIDATGQKWILEAKAFMSGLCRTKWENRYKDFTYYGEIKGVDYSNKLKEDDWIKRLQMSLNKNNYRDKNGNKLKANGIADELLLSACPTLMYGIQGDPIVKLVQEKLHRLGYYNDKISGNWGKITNAAVYQYQLKEVGIKEPSKVLKKNGTTWAKLLGL